MKVRRHTTPSATPPPPDAGTIPPSIDPGSSIRHLQRHEIDNTKWDTCITEAANSLIYGRSYYLDAMAAGQWSALVLDDYRAIMPLPWRSKAGIRYLYQPAFTQQTGIFSLQPVSPGLISAFLQQLRRHYRFAEIFLNFQNEYPSLQKHSNCILPLDTTYHHLYASYKKDLLRNLKEASHTTLHYVKDEDPGTALHHYRRQYQAKIRSFKDDDYRNFEKLCHYLRGENQLLVRSVIGPNEQALSFAVLPRDSNRLYLLQSTTLPEGRALSANHFLLDRLIHEFAGTSLILDFEGSDLPGVAHFYENFGVTNQPYFYYRHNHLPWPLRLLK